MSHDAAPGRWQALAILCFGVVGVLATWFSATAILPDLTRRWELGTATAAWLTNGVQIGFVVGALGASLVNLPDIVRMQRLMAYSALLAASANLGLLFAGPEAAIALRILTGIALAGVYPPALKLMATWYVRGRGLALGFLIGALTLGSSLPHLIRAVTEGVDWRAVILFSSATAASGAVLFAFTLKEGPHAFSRAVFAPRKVGEIFTRKPLMLANLGYFGHMWELYAMWAWILAFATAAESGRTDFPFGTPSMLAFVVVSSGAIGCVLGGLLSDKIGRCLTTAGFMAISGCAAVAIGFAFDGPAWLLGLVAVIWGMSIVGDSAQFSAAVTELADQSFVGTALALQLGIGFALTVGVIWAVPIVAAWLGGWQWAFLFLVPGPIVGTAAMLRLRSLPEATQLAGGAR